MLAISSKAAQVAIRGNVCPPRQRGQFPLPCCVVKFRGWRRNQGATRMMRAMGPFTRESVREALLISPPRIS